MEVGLYVINDKVAKQAGPIFEARNDAVATRMLLHMFKQNAESIQNLEEFELVYIGSFDKDNIELKAATKYVVNTPKEVKE